MGSTGLTLGELRRFVDELASQGADDALEVTAVVESSRLVLPPFCVRYPINLNARVVWNDRGITFFVDADERLPL